MGSIQRSYYVQGLVAHGALGVKSVSWSPSAAGPDSAIIGSGGGAGSQMTMEINVVMASPLAASDPPIGLEEDGEDWKAMFFLLAEQYQVFNPTSSGPK